MNRTQLRQGDVLAEALPAEAIAALDRCGLTFIEPEQAGVILAHGEVTFHSHRIENPEIAKLYRIDAVDAEFARIMARSGVTVAPGDQILRVAEQPATVVHEEHAAHTLAPGVYLVTIAEEYVAPQVVRRVAD